jgi:hypothetical protein
VLQLPRGELCLEILGIGGLIKGDRRLHEELVLDVVATDLRMILLNDLRVLLGRQLVVGVVGQVCWCQSLQLL